MIVSDWIFEENLKPFVEMVAFTVGAEFDDNIDWVAISYGIPGTDDDAGQWFEYSFMGTTRLDLALARSPGATVISVRLDSEQEQPELRAKLEMLIMVCQDYTLRSNHA